MERFRERLKYRSASNAPVPASTSNGAVAAGVDGRGRFVGMGRDRSKGFGSSWCPQEAVCDLKAMVFPEREMSAANLKKLVFFLRRSIMLTQCYASATLVNWLFTQATRSCETTKYLLSGSAARKLKP
jgi:hypothetical protein